MKKTATFLLCLLAAAAQAQPPTLTYSMLPNEGDSYTFVSDPTSAQTVTAGPSGTNQTWDFSTLNTSGTQTTRLFVANTTMPSGSLFPMANLGALTGTQQAYYMKDTTGVYSLGTMVQNSQFLNSDAQRIYGVPMTFGDAYHDSAVANYPSSPTYMIRRSNIHAEADGYGTLTMPNNTVYNNALRVKYTTLTVDSINNSGSLNISTTTSTYYDWYDGIKTFPILTIGQTVANGTATPFVRIRISQVINGLTVNEGSGFRLQPNPADATSWLQLDQAGQIEVYDLQGRMVWSHNQPTADRVLLPTLEWNNGMYLVVQRNAQETRNLRLVVQHP